MVLYVIFTATGISLVEVADVADVADGFRCAE